jgi:glucose-1-phosphate cytidylyltransferase
MKAVILAGGMGTRLVEETNVKPKPMLEIGGKPILWHIMKIYTAYGINDFIICLGYKGYVIKEFFANYLLHTSDVTFDMRAGELNVHQKETEPWSVTLINTGDKTLTGGRLKRVREYLGDEDFCLTYGDGVADINISELIRFHKSHTGLATVTAVQPPGRFGVLSLEEGLVTTFTEKPQGEGAWINGGFYVLSPKVLDYIEGDYTSFELAPMEALAREQQLYAFRHEGFWRPMDTLRDKNYLEELWVNHTAPWKVW